MTPMRRLALALPLVAMLAGCTVVTVVGADGEVMTRRGIGVIAVETRPSQRPQLVRTYGFGIVSDGGTTTIGYHASEVVLLPRDDCRIVVWANGEQPAAAQAWLADLPDNICHGGVSGPLQEERAE